MLQHSRVLLIATLLGVCVACDSRHSSAAFRLPQDGNVERGKEAFAELGCASCHRMSGVELPPPSVQPPVPVVLGGEVELKLSDAYLVTALINPSHQLAPYPKEQIAIGGVSRMPNYSDKMSVRQMVDTVAFLQSRYVERPTMPTYSYR